MVKDLTNSKRKNLVVLINGYESTLKLHKRAVDKIGYHVMGCGNQEEADRMLGSFDKGDLNVGLVVIEEHKLSKIGNYPNKIDVRYLADKIREKDSSVPIVFSPSNIAEDRETICEEKNWIFYDSFGEKLSYFENIIKENYRV